MFFGPVRRIMAGNTHIKDNYVRIHNPRKKEIHAFFIVWTTFEWTKVEISIK